MGPSGEVRETMQGTGIGPGPGGAAAGGGGGVPQARGELLSLEQLQAMAQKDDKKARKKVGMIATGIVYNHVGNSP